MMLFRKLQRTAQLIFALICFSGCSPLTTTGPEAGWQSLFDGKSIENWRPDGEATWVVTAGDLTTKPDDKGGFLVTQQRFTNFHLSLEFWPDAEVNSGIFIRCPDSRKITADDCYELNIWDEHPNQSYRTGSIVKRLEPMAHAETIGKWNTYDIVATGNEIVARVNGVVTARLKDDLFASGYIALQRFNAGRIKFRNLKIREL